MCTENMVRGMRSRNSRSVSGKRQFREESARGSCGWRPGTWVGEGDGERQPGFSRIRESKRESKGQQQTRDMPSGWRSRSSSSVWSMYSKT